jgi:malate dehydrogenase (oxaloacetate-decarboxylating)(NADP+)
VAKYRLDRLENVEIIDPRKSKKTEVYSKLFQAKRKRKGVTPKMSSKFMRRRNFFGPMMVEAGDADAVINGITQSYPEAIRPMVMAIGAKEGQRLAGIYIMNCRSRIIFFADTTVNMELSAEELAHVAIDTARVARDFLQAEPRVAMISYSNFGSAPSEMNTKIQKAVDIAKKMWPDLIIDGEMQIDTAVDAEIAEEFFPFSEIKGDANVMIFPNLASANIAYKLLMRVGGAEAIGPILIGMKKPVNVLQRASTVQDVVNMTTITAMKIQAHREGKAFA